MRLVFGSVLMALAVQLVTATASDAFDIGVKKGQREHVATFNCGGSARICKATICLKFKNVSDGGPALVHHWRKIAINNETKDLARARGERCLKYTGSSSYYVDVMPIEQDIIVTVADDMKPR
jgi:hypothetical protein